MNTATIGAEAQEKLKACFTDERWQKIVKQAVKQAVDLQELCTRLLATSAACYPGNDQAALYSAANRLLITLSSTLQPADVARFEAALKPANVEPLAEPATEGGAVLVVTKRRGGKAEPAPAPAN